MSAPRKPHSDIAGYVSERICRHDCGGHIVIYDRERGADWIDADDRWIVFHEPSGLHVSVTSLRQAHAIMRHSAAGGTDYDIIPGKEEA